MSVSTGALTTRDRLTAFIGLTDLTAAQNTVIDLIIDGASDWVEAYCQRSFARTDFTNEMYDGNDSPYLMLRNYPIDMDQTFTVDQRTTALDSADWESIDSENYFKHPIEGYLNFPLAGHGVGGGGVFRVGTQNYRVTYTAGYYLPQDASYTQGAADSLPVDIEMAVWKMCAGVWNDRRGDTNVTEESIGAYSVKYAKESFEDERILDILNKYSRIDTLSYRS